MYYILAQAVGFIGMGLYIISYQFKKNQWLIWLQLGSTAAYAVHFFMLHAPTGCALQIVTMVSYSLLVYNGDHPGSWASWKGWKWILSGIFTTAAILTWKGPLDFLPCLSAVSMTFANWTRNGKTMRLIRLFISAPGWLIYDIMAVSYSGILCELFGIVSVLISIYRYGLKELDRVD